MAKVVTFGEIMLRLAPNGYYRFFQNDQMQATFGGGEANVAVSLANFGLHAAFVTKLPSHAIGQGAVNSLRALGVDTSYIVRGGDRIGVYYLEKGASQRGSVCIYDRAHSAIQTAEPSEFEWDRILDGADWFYDEVLWAYENGVMDGIGGGKFGPNDVVSRAMVWTVLARMSGKAISGAGWADQARAWAMAEGITDGSMASGSVTREQLATMLYRASGSPVASGSLEAYPDAAKVADWAKDAMVWAAERGIINGMDGKLNPQGGATRAQLVTMLMRLDAIR